MHCTSSYYIYFKQYSPLEVNSYIVIKLDFL